MLGGGGGGAGGAGGQQNSKQGVPSSLAQKGMEEPGAQPGHAWRSVQSQEHEKGGDGGGAFGGGDGDSGQQWLKHAEPSS